MLSFLRSLLNPFIGERPLRTYSNPVLSQSHLGLVIDSAPYEPDIQDVLAVKSIIIKASRSSIPIDLVDEIIDYASYWPRICATAQRQVTARGSSSYSDVLVLRTKPLCALASAHREWQSTQNLPEPRLEYPARQVVLTLQSHDQGWSGEAEETKGTYYSSYTWFDAEIKRPKLMATSEGTITPTSMDFLRASETLPDVIVPSQNENLTSSGENTSTEPPIFPTAEDRLKYVVQYNVQATRASKEHRVVWDWRDDIESDSPAADELRKIGRGKFSGDGKFVRALKLGDCVELWAKARYPGWANHVESAQVEILFAI